MGKKSKQGLTVKKDEDFSEWFTQLIQKADLADYTDVSGCIVFKPRIWAVWEKIRDEIDNRLKPMNVKNVYFPMLIPEKFLAQEASHVEGFAPEVAWVTHAGETKLNERLAIRPTSEAIMYPSFSKWVRSWRDLPQKYNQWSNVIRWEFKHATPLMRTREFVFNEGHTVFATEKDALAEQKPIINMYTDICENYLALPFYFGKKSEKEKFAGAVFTVSMEFLLPNGKAAQGPDFHHDGQNFAKAYDIKFKDEKENEQYVWQNTWAISTRMLGIMVMIHSDDKGLVMPPKLAPEQVVIIPILFDDSKDKVLKKAIEIKEKLEKSGVTAFIDDRTDYSPGWKFNEWELKGIPIRLELGPRDLANNSVMMARRDTGDKKAVSIKDVDKEVVTEMDSMQKALLRNAKKMLKNSTVDAKDWKEFMKSVKEGKIVNSYFCGSVECEEVIKDKSGGAKTLNMPLKQPDVKGKKCVQCGKSAKFLFRFGKSY
ncbi:MAG: proline--tRNA ligase [Nanoarchaeota archaeon]|nr:proline--tRNA ligase [Nanoarchaeota archaeon]